MDLMTPQCTMPKLQIKVNIEPLGEAEANSKCQILKHAIQEIYRKNFSGLSFEELYRIVYDLVLRHRGDLLYSCLEQVISNHVFSKVKNELKKSTGGGILSEVLSAWKDHLISIQVIRDTFMYLDRVHVTRSNTSDVYSMAMKMFSEVIISDSQICAQLTRDMLRAVNDERRSLIIDSCGSSVTNHINQVDVLDSLLTKTALRNACDMLLVLGLGSRDVYEKVFEKPLIQSTEEYYRKESASRLMRENVVEYVTQVERWVEDETDLANHCFDRNTANTIIALIEMETIGKHMKTMLEREGSGVLSLIKKLSLDDLGVMNRMLSRVDVSPMYNCISEYLRNVGKALVSDQSSATSPVTYIQSLLKLKEEYDMILYESFDGDQTFRQMVWSNFEYFINRNVRSPEFLSLFIDDQLRRGIHGMSDQEMELILDRSLVLFRFLQEKDVFERYYKQHLARRLLLNRSISDDTEKNMISKLKVECGSQFTSQMEHMFKDMSLSDTLNEEFKSHLTTSTVDEGHELELNVRVLTTGHWPISTSPLRCVIPSEALSLYESFERFYLGEHSERLLTLQTYHGTADLYAYFYPTADRTASLGSATDDESSSAAITYDLRPSCAIGWKACRKHILIVSTAQMSILMLFNRADSWTYEEIQMETEIPDRELMRALQSLSMGRIGQRVLLKEPKTSNIDRQHEFSVNANFSSKLYRVRIQNVAAKGEMEAERMETRCRVDDERKHEVEAAIVRIMKARRTLKHNSLIAEVTQQLKRRFLPCPQMIEKRVDGLIQREYLAKSKEDQKVYTYTA